MAVGEAEAWGGMSIAGLCFVRRCWRLYVYMGMCVCVCVFA